MSLLKRRQFLALTAQSMGMYGLANLYKGLPLAHAQASSPKKRVVFVYFYHGAIIKPTNYNGGAVTHDKGNWTFEKPLFGGREGALSQLSQVRGESRIIRGISQEFDLRKDTNHIQSQSSALTACALDPTKKLDRAHISGSYNGRSIDLLIGEHLQKIHKTRAPYLIVGSEADQPSSDPTPLWITSSYENYQNYIRPFTNLKQLKETLFNDLSCFPTGLGNSEQQAAKLISQRNIYSVIKRNIAQFGKERLLPSQEFKKLTNQIEENRSNVNKKLQLLEQNGNFSNLKCLKTLPSDAELNSYKNFKLHDKTYFQNRNQSINKMVTFALANNYTNVATIYHNNFSTTFHDAAHESGFNQNNDTQRAKLRVNIDLSIGLVNDLINQLKANNLYEDTMIVVATEFSSQGDNHNLSNMPWLVINSGQGGEYDPRRRIHIGDLHTSIAKKTGLTLNSFGGTEHILKRSGQYNSALLG